MKKIFTSVMAMAFAMTMSAQNVVTATEAVTISTAFTNDVIHEAPVGSDYSTAPTFGDHEPIITDDHGCMYVSDAVLASLRGGLAARLEAMQKQQAEMQRLRDQMKKR